MFNIPKMDEIDYKIQAILDNQYEIELEQYWELTEEQRDKLANIISDIIIQNYKNDFSWLDFHCSVLDDRRMEAEYLQEYERADLIIRITNKLLNFINSK
jgi:hypothetical protein